MNRALAFTLLALAAVVVAFVATWLTIPSGRYEQKNLTTGQWESGRITYPARLFRAGLVEREVEPCVATREDPFHNFDCGINVFRRVDLHTVRQRVVIAYGGLAVVVILVGVAFGALRRKPSSPPPPAPPTPA
jgi:hypothetical protein